MNNAHHVGDCFTKDWHFAHFHIDNMMLIFLHVRKTHLKRKAKIFLKVHNIEIMSSTEALF